MNAVDVVEAQLRAYNAHDLEAWAATYAPLAEQHALHGGLLARGREAIRVRATTRFAEPDLHAQLLHRTVMALGDGESTLVVDHERVRRHFPEGPGTVEMVCAYEVRDGFIQRATFATGPQQLDRAGSAARP